MKGFLTFLKGLDKTLMLSSPIDAAPYSLWKQPLLCVNDELSMSIFYSFLLETNHLEKVISILPSIPGSVPLEILKPAMLNATQGADWTEMITVALSVIPPEKLTELGADVSGLFYLK